MILIQEIGWRVLVPLVGALICAIAAHKPMEDKLSEGYEFFLFRTRSFHRNFFLNANFALLISWMQLFSEGNYGLVMFILTSIMFGFSWVISRLFSDVPHDIYSEGRMKKITIVSWLISLFVIVLIVMTLHFEWHKATGE